MADVVYSLQDDDLKQLGPLRDLTRRDVLHESMLEKIQRSVKHRAAMFAAEQDSDDVDSPYLLIQRQFEDPDDNWCYIETHDKNYIGHFHLRRVEFTPRNLSIEVERPRDNLVSVTFAMTTSDFEEASRVVKIISGEIHARRSRRESVTLLKDLMDASKCSTLDIEDEQLAQLGDLLGSNRLQLSHDLALLAD